MPARVRRTVGRSIAYTACALLSALAVGTVPAAASPCPSGEIHTASGCTSFREARRDIREIVDRAARENDLHAALVRVDSGDRRLARVAAGNSMAGVPANFQMQFRIGSIAIPYLITLLLQLQDEGRLSLDDPVSSWLPNLPNADRVTLRMLANNTSGYPDWAQGNPAFIDAFNADVFRQWRTNELLDIAFAQPLACDPGSCFHYAHTNFVIISRVLQRETGRSAATMLKRRVLRPLGLNETRISALPGMPEPVLHAYVTDRGPFEDSTFWSPSWTIAKSTIMSSTISDVVSSAKALGEGLLISPAASRERFEASTAGLGPFNETFYYGLGVLAANSWVFQNPQLNGWRAIMAYQPTRRLGLGLVVTTGQVAADSGANYAQRLFNQLTEYLTPNRPVELPG